MANFRISVFIVLGVAVFVLHPKPGEVEVDPTSLPELSKPFRAQNFKEKTEKMKFQKISKKIKKITSITF